MPTLFSFFLTDRSGNFATIAAMVILPLLLAAGVAVDYYRASDNRSDIQAAVDTAAMAVAVHYSDNRLPDAAVVDGQRVFAANCLVPDCVADTYPDFVITPGVSVTAAYDANIATTLMKLAGVGQLSYALRSEVNLAQRFQQYYFAVDRSGSTGIAADDASIERLMAISKTYYDDPNHRSPNGCAFACHVPDGAEPYRNNKQLSLYEIAKDNNIRLREDVVAEAVDNAAAAILANITGTHADQVLVGAYAFSDDIELLTKPTANSTNISQAIKNSRITSWGTRYDIVMPKLTSAVGVSGSGSSKDDPEKTLIMITDGADVNYFAGDKDSTYWFRSFSSSYCSALKANGVRVVVVDMAYPRQPGEYIYDNFAAPYVDSMSPALKACASEGYYYHAGDTPEIAATLTKMTKAVTRAELRFTR